MANDTNSICSTSTVAGPNPQAPKIKLGDALKAIGQNVQGFEIDLTRDDTPINAAIFE